MVYYKVIRDFNHYSARGVYEFVEGELLTHKEFIYLKTIMGGRINPRNFDAVDIPPKKTVWIFGARKERED